MKILPLYSQCVLMESQVKFSSLQNISGAFSWTAELVQGSDGMHANDDDDDNNNNTYYYYNNNDHNLIQ